MMNLTKFPSFLVLIMITSSVFSEEIFLDCVVDLEIHEMDIDFDNHLGKWAPYSSRSFTENASDPQYGLSINQNQVRFGKKPFDYIEIDLSTLKAIVAISIGKTGDDIFGGQSGDDISGGQSGDDIFGGQSGDDISGGQSGDDIFGGIREGICERVPDRKNNS